MREILFRGKRSDNGEWVVGHLLKYEDGRARINESHTDIFCYEKDRSIIQTVAYEVNPETVGQYTGRKIKDKRVFDGDIIFARYSRLLVGFDVDYLAWWTFYFDENGNTRRFCPLGDIAYWETGGVIGNIHDNPELVEADT